MAAIKQLYELQVVDLEIDWRRARLAEIASTLGDESSLAPLRDAASQGKAAVQAETVKQNALDTVVSGFDEKIKGVEAKLYSGTVTLARELTDLQADIDMIKRQRTEQEDELLEILEDLDNAQKISSAATVVLANSEVAWAADQQSMTTEKGVLDGELVDLTVSRDDHAAAIPAPDIALYEQIRPRHKGKAVAKLQGDTCGSCRTGVDNRTVQQARASTDPIKCPNCGLILLAG
jgi:predicted  nucleic acid-binding Zn-ribbon protein